MHGRNSGDPGAQTSEHSVYLSADEAGAVIRRIEAAVTRHSYDTQLQQGCRPRPSTDPGAGAWTVDSAGNRSNAGYSYDALNRMTASPFGAYQHDAAGNRTWEDYGSSTNAVKHTWDSLNRMTVLQGVSAGASYRYRADGMRVSKREGVTLGVNITEETVSGYYDIYATDRPTTRYYHDGQSGYEEDYTRKVSGTDTVDVVRYGLGPRGIESQRVWSGAAGSALPQTALGFPVYDTHGNNVGMVSISGTVAHERTYSPWGEVVSSTGSPPQQGYCANLGHRSDPESALTYMRARYYEPSTGRFLTEDPARDGTNWYSYCNSNPSNLVDRSGKLPDDPWHALGELIFHMGNMRAQLGLIFIGLGAMQMYLGFSAILGRLSSGAAKILLAHGKVVGTLLSAWGIATMASGANTFARGLMMMQAGKILMALGEDGWEYASTFLYGASGGFGLPDLLADWHTGSDDGLWRR